MVDPGGNLDESQEGLPPGTRLGKYAMVRLLGAGGMGAVYEGVHTEIGKRVAIKVLSPAIAAVPGARARFLREAQLTSRVRHPNIVDVTDMGSDGGQTYLVMELLNGEDLSQRLGRMGPLPPQHLADIMLPVCSAVVEAHKAGITHRDLKPQTIFLAVGPHSTQPKVLDFGISKGNDLVGAGTLTGTGAMIGTPFYLAPEQIIDARAAGPNSDQYALGVIMYECLTGARPFEAENLFVVFQAIVGGNPIPPTQRRPGIPADLEAVVLRAMHLTPAARFRSILSLGRALLPFASVKQRSIWEEAFTSADEVSSGATQTIDAPAASGALAAPRGEGRGGLGAPSAGSRPAEASRGTPPPLTHATPVGRVRPSVPVPPAAVAQRTGAVRPDTPAAPSLGAAGGWTVDRFSADNQTVADVRRSGSHLWKVLLGVALAAGGAAAVSAIGRRGAGRPSAADTRARLSGAGVSSDQTAARAAPPPRENPASISRAVAMAASLQGAPGQVPTSIGGGGPSAGSKPPAAGGSASTTDSASDLGTVGTPATYQMSLRVDPGDASVELDGQRLTRAERERALPRDHIRHRLRITAPGYLDQTVEFVDEAPPSPIRLKRARRSTAAKAEDARARDPARGVRPSRPEPGGQVAAPAAPAPARNLNPNGAPVID